MPGAVKISELLSFILSLIPRLKGANHKDAALVSDLTTLRSRAFARLELHGPVAAGARDAESAVLDEAATKLWNEALMMRHAHDAQLLPLFALARSTSAVLLEVATPEPRSVDDVARLVACFAKAAASSSETADMETAETLVQRAAEMVTALGDATNNASNAHVEARTAFWMARLDIACAQGREPVASYAFKMLDDETLASKLSVSVHARIAERILKHASGILRGSLTSQSKQPLSQAIEWLQRIVVLLERSNGPSITQLLTRTLRKLARAYLEAGRTDKKHLVTAETTLDELVKLYRSTGDARENDSRLTFLRIDALRTRGAPEVEITSAVSQLIKQLEWRELEVQKTLRLLRHFERKPALLARLTNELLQAALAAKETGGHKHVGRITISYLMFVKDSQQRNAMREMLGAMAATSDFELSQAEAFALSTLAWKAGDRLMKQDAGMVLQAAEFYALATHEVFRAFPLNTAKTLRKVALCHLEAGNPIEAQQAIASCAPAVADDAQNHFILYLAALRIKNEEAALTALSALVGAPNFTSRMLPLIVEEAQQAGMRQVLLRALALTAERATKDPYLARDVDAIALNRSIVRLFLPSEDTEMNGETAESLLKALHSSLVVFKEASHTYSDKLVKEVEWSAKTAYNTALGSSVLLEPRQVTALFDVCLELLEICGSFEQAPLDASMHTMKVMACLTALTGRSLETREAEVPALQKAAAWEEIRQRCQLGRELLAVARESASDEQVHHEIELALLIFDFEALTRLRQWSQLESFVINALNSSPPAKVLEIWAEVLHDEGRAPPQLVARCMRAIVETLWQAPELEITRLARWLRALVELGWNSPASEEAQHDTLEYLSLAQAIMKEPMDSAYPPDEMLWLLAKAWDCGFELWSSGSPREAKPFCEAAIQICELQPDGGGELRGQLHAQYKNLLSTLGQQPEAEDEVMSEA